mmetsp:Transcript_76773/g.217235  ORF Transcript_76773/g.217235 Transcript_76773/m.217235 type:complete len:202 (+) Transcript_76773:716-1321(+)
MPSRSVLLEGALARVPAHAEVPAGPAPLVDRVRPAGVALFVHPAGHVRAAAKLVGGGHAVPNLIALARHVRDHARLLLRAAEPAAAAIADLARRRVCPRALASAASPRGAHQRRRWHTSNCRRLAGCRGGRSPRGCRQRTRCSRCHCCRRRARWRCRHCRRGRDAGGGCRRCCGRRRRGRRPCRQVRGGRRRHGRRPRRPV